MYLLIPTRPNIVVKPYTQFSLQAEDDPWHPERQAAVKRYKATTEAMRRSLLKGGSAFLNWAKRGHLLVDHITDHIHAL